jgi:uridine kinase
VIIIDGIYSCRPELDDVIDLSVLVEAPAAIRRQRHNEREATDEAGWHSRWDDAEDHYFAHVRPPESYDLVVHLWPR